MKHSKRNNFTKLCLVLIFIFCNAVAAADILDHIRADIVKDTKAKENIGAVVLNSFHNDDVDAKQIVQINYKNKTIFLVPSINYNVKISGCYLTVLDGEKKISERIILQRSEDALSCEGVLTLFTCNSTTIGVGAIYGLRLGADKYYTQAAFYEFDSESRLAENKNLSNKIGDADTAIKAKLKLGCK